MLVFVRLAGLGVSASKEMIAVGHRSGLARVRSELLAESLLPACPRKLALHTCDSRCGEAARGERIQMQCQANVSEIRCQDWNIPTLALEFREARAVEVVWTYVYAYSSQICTKASMHSCRMAWDVMGMACHGMT